MNHFCKLALLALALTPGLVRATDIYSIPAGYQTYTLPQLLTSHLSLTLTQDPVYTDTVAAASGPTVQVATVGAATFPVSPNAPYFLKFTSGAQSGRILQVLGVSGAYLINLNTTDGYGSAIAPGVPLTGNTTSLTTKGTVLTNDPTSFNVRAGDSFQVFPGDTLASLFGDGTIDNPLQITGGISVTSADSIGLPVRTGDPVQIYYFDTGRNYWVHYQPKVPGYNSVSANLTVVPPYAELNLSVHQAKTETFTALGQVSSVGLLTRLPSLSTSYTSLKCPTDFVLTDLSLGINWQQGGSVGFADTLGIHSTKSFIDVNSIYFLDPANTWRVSNDLSTDSGAVPITSGSYLTVKQNNSVNGAQAFIKCPQPYSVTQ